jgi:hypothetical protein
MFARRRRQRPHRFSWVGRAFRSRS